MPRISLPELPAGYRWAMHSVTKTVTSPTVRMLFLERFSSGLWMEELQEPLEQVRTPEQIGVIADSMWKRHLAQQEKKPKPTVPLDRMMPDLRRALDTQHQNDDLDNEQEQP